MKTKLLSLFVALIATSALWASNTITYTATFKLTKSSLTVGATTFGSAITSHTFSNGTGTITCSGEITTIGDKAFYDCSGLTSITIPNSVTTIGESAFKECSGLTSITIPNSVTTIGRNAFFGCSSLTSVTLNANTITSKDYTSLDNMGSIFGTQVTEYILGNSVTEIGDYAFYNCSGLTSITIPNSVTEIGKQAFQACLGLTSVTIPNSVTTIEDGTFVECNGLTSITIPNSVTTIGRSAFYDCRSLTSVTIPNSVTTIGERAFGHCIGLTSITIPNSVTTIGDEAFIICIHLNSINVDAANTHYCAVDGVLFTYAKDTLIQYPIGNTRTEYTILPSVTTIGNVAFYYCTGLTSITIPNSVTTIGGFAFEGCSGLTSVTIGNSVTTIGDYAFRDCSGLTSITCNAIIPPTCEDDCFHGVDHSIPLYVPVNSVSAYQTANEWKEFTNILSVEETDLETVDGSQCTMHNVKFIKDGRLLIERNGIRYNAHGARVE